MREGEAGCQRILLNSPPWQTFYSTAHSVAHTRVLYTRCSTARRGNRSKICIWAQCSCNEGCVTRLSFGVQVSYPGHRLSCLFSTIKFNIAYLVLQKVQSLRCFWMVLFQVCNTMYARYKNTALILATANWLAFEIVMFSTLSTWGLAKEEKKSQLCIHVGQKSAGLACFSWISFTFFFFFASYPISLVLPLKDYRWKFEKFSCRFK